MTQPLARRDWGELGPAMRALPRNQWRAFVEYFLLEPPGHGAQTAAARRAGFGTPTTTPLNMARIASRLIRDDRIISALAEEARKIVRGGAPEAAKALLNLVRDPTHRDHVRGIAMVMARTDPEIGHHELHVSHKIVDPDQEALEELRALRHLDTPRDKLLELFGSNGLDRIEGLEAADTASRASAAKVIDGEVIDMRPIEQPEAAAPQVEAEADPDPEMEDF